MTDYRNDAPASDSEIVVSLGSNSGDRHKSVADAIAWLNEVLSDALNSDIYETPPFGHPGSSYMNAVVKGKLPTGMNVEALERACKEYEMEHGRDAKARMLNKVPIDIDIVKAGSVILRPADFQRGFFRIGYVQLSGL